MSRTSLGQLPDAEVLAGADVDVVFLVVVLHEEQARIGEVVHVQELARGAAGPPDLDLAPRSTFASWNLRISAGRTWLLLRSKLSFGPYRLVGIAEMKLHPYWRAVRRSTA